HQLRADQDRLARPFRPHGKVQPAPSHRGGAGEPGEIPGPRGAQGSGLGFCTRGGFVAGLRPATNQDGIELVRGHWKDRTMDQTPGFQPKARRRAVERLSNLIAAAVDSARAVDAPFYHLQFDRVFPDEVYTAMLTAMPVASDYRPMSGRSKGL